MGNPLRLLAINVFQFLIHLGILLHIHLQHSVHLLKFTLTKQGMLVKNRPFHSFLRVVFQHALNDAFALLRSLYPLVMEIGVSFDLLEELLFIGVEWQFAVNHLIKDGSKREHVCWVAVRFVLDNLRCHESRCSE